MVLLAPFAFALGANRGACEAALRNAVGKIASTPGIFRLRVSPLYRTRAVNVAGGRDFLNAVFLGQTRLSAGELVQLAARLEAEAGRPAQGRGGGPPYADRELDVDLLFFNREIIREPNLQVPHPRLSQRGFVVVPLSRVCPYYSDPAGGESMTQMAARFKDDPGVALEKEVWL